MPEDQQNPEIPDKIRIYFEKSPNYRVIHANGAWGGPTPQGGVQIAFYSDLQPIPDYMVHSVHPDGTLGSVITKATRDGMIREVEVTLVFTPQVAIEVMSLLHRLVQPLMQGDANNEQVVEQTSTQNE